MSGPEPETTEPDPLVLLRVAAFPFASLEPLRARAALEPLRELLPREQALALHIPMVCGALHQAAGPPVPGHPERQRKRLAIVALRRDLHNHRMPEAAVLEEALSALDPLTRQLVEDHIERARDLHTLDTAFRDGFDADLLAARRALLELASAPRFREGIRLASRTLHQNSNALASADPNRWNHDERHVASKLAAYAARGAAKTSPSSVFCATALAAVTSGPAGVAGKNDLARVEILLNVFEARKVTACLGSEPAFRAAARLRPNPTLREADGVWTFWRPASLRRLTDDEVLARVKDLPVLRMLLEEAAEAREPGELLRVVAKRSDTGFNELSDFLGKVVEAGVFSWEVEIPYKDRHPLRTLAHMCRVVQCGSDPLSEIEETEEQVDALRGLTSEERIERLDGIGRRLEHLPHARALKQDELFRLDAASGLEVALPRPILGEVQEAVERYARLFAALYPESILRAGYAKRFLAAHPPDQDVPLLDLYHGVFEPETLLRPDSFPGPADAAAGEATVAAERAFVRARDAFARLARQAQEQEKHEVLLDAEDWSEILEEGPAPRWFCGVLFQVEAAVPPLPGPRAITAPRPVTPPDVADPGARIVINDLFTGSGLASARLDSLHGGGHGTGEGPIAREVKRGWSRLERPGAILAEVTYMHWGRTANAGLRPSLFPYEIELPGETASPGAQVIPLRELVARYDSGAKRFVLRWPQRELEVIPVIGSGISPEGFVSFLVSVGQQGFQPLTYFPGFEAEGIVAWPRFTWGRTVLFRRRWLLPAEALPAELRDPAAPEAEAFAALARLRHRHRIPRHVFVHTSAEPKPFYADLESPILADLVHRAASPRRDRPAPRGDRPSSGDGQAGPALTFTEMLPAPEGLWVGDAAGRYASEFLVQLHGPADSRRPPRSVALPAARGTRIGPA